MDSNSNNIPEIKDIGNTTETSVILRNKSKSSPRELSLIEEERSSKLESLDLSPPMPIQNIQSESRIPILKPTPVKGILKIGRERVLDTSASVTHTSATPSHTADITQPSATLSSCSSGVQSADNKTVTSQSAATMSSLEYLEETIRRADESVCSLNLSSGGMQCVDIDIGEGDRASTSVDTSANVDTYTSVDTFTSLDTLTSMDPYTSIDHLDNSVRQTNTLPLRVNPVISSSSKDNGTSTSMANHHLSRKTTVRGGREKVPVSSTRLHTKSPRSLKSPGNPGEYTLVPSVQSPSGYAWTSQTLPLYSPGDSPSRRPSSSGSPLSPASGHQTIVYVPIITNGCQCHHSHSHHDSLHELVSQRRRRSSTSTRDDDQMSLASSIDTEVARYLADHRSETGSNVDVLESQSLISLKREDRIQRALLVKSVTVLSVAPSVSNPICSSCDFIF